MIKKPKLTVIQQFIALKRDYDFGTIKMIGSNKLVWEGILKSSPIGNEYLIRVSYKREGVPEIFVLEPKNLKLPEGNTKLRHVYSHAEQKLCLYYPKAKEWTSTQTIASTIMPWAIDWLYHYETWLITGEWTGGGIEHVGEKK